MAREEWSGEPDEPSGGSVGLVLALILGGVVLLLLLVCGGGLAFVWMAREAQVEARLAEEEAAVAARDAHREADMAAIRLPEGGVKLLTREQLAGARLESAAGPPDVVWDFAPERFVLHIRQGLAPELVFPGLLGDGKAPARFEGRWRLSKDAKTLELTDVTGDKRPASASVTLPITIMELGSVDLAGRRYNLLPGAVHERPKKD
jgi:hypothetical protein